MKQCFTQGTQWWRTKDPFFLFGFFPSFFLFSFLRKAQKQWIGSQYSKGQWILLVQHFWMTNEISRKKTWFNVKCHHLRKGGSKQRHGYFLQLWCNHIGPMPITGKPESWGISKLPIPTSDHPGFNIQILDPVLYSKKVKEVLSIWTSRDYLSK